MIFWRGLGILAIPIPFGFSLIFDILFDSTMMNGIGTIIGAIIIWFLGRYLNLKKGKLVASNELNQEVKIKNHHRLLWIDMQYWAFFFFIIGAGVALESFFKYNIEAIYTNAAAITLIIIFFVSNFKYFTNIFRNKSIILDEDKPHSDKVSRKNKPPIQRAEKNQKTEVKDDKFKELRESSKTKFAPTDHSRFKPK